MKEEMTVSRKYTIATVFIRLIKKLIPVVIECVRENHSDQWYWEQADKLEDDFYADCEKVEVNEKFYADYDKLNKFFANCVEDMKEPK